MYGIVGRPSRLLVGVAILIAAAMPADAGKTRYVSPTGMQMAPYTNWSRAARSIQMAARISVAGDVIVVADGVYVITNQIVVPGRVRLVSKSGPARTIIQGNGATRCVYMPGPKSSLTGFTITGGMTATNGAGVYCDNGTVSECVITGNQVIGQAPCGGGIYAVNWSVISNCVVSHNGAVATYANESDKPFSHAWGGGIYAYYSTVIRCVVEDNSLTAGNSANGAGLFCNSRMEHCIVSANTAYGHTYAQGGGVYSDVGGRLRNCLVVGNRAYSDRGLFSGLNAQGGGVYFFSGGGLENCTVADNDVDGEYASAGGYHCGAGDLIVNSIIVDNTATARITASHPDFRPNPNWLPVISNSFIGGSAGFAEGSYRLDPAVPSPCIDAGTNAAWMTKAKDLDGNARIINARVDLGAYEYDSVVRKIIGLSGSLAFGQVLTGQTATATLTITNRGNTALTVSGITYPAKFSGAWSGSVPPKGSQGVTVTFSPLAAKLYGGTVTVISDKTSGGNTIGISGAGGVPGTICLGGSAYTATEGTSVSIAVKRINGSAGKVSVNYWTKPVTALAGKDYTSRSGTLTWTHGQTAPKVIKIAIAADGKTEGAEEFQILLKEPEGTILTAPFRGKITILGNVKTAP